MTASEHVDAFVTRHGMLSSELEMRVKNGISHEARIVGGQLDGEVNKL